MRKKIQLLFGILTLLFSIGSYPFITTHVPTLTILTDFSDSDPTGT
ncbi:hypothetical protein [Marininema halotolerans]|nr:hypothetical protein [Marininema halotolerans]